jgi:pyroglutamyl-peptidase
VRILLTGFQPFGKVDVNPSQCIIEHFAARNCPDLIARVLPTEYRASAQAIEAAILAEQPDAVVCLGVAQSRKTISLERIAVNLDDAPLADNAGVLASGERIVPGGPAAYWSTLPLEAMRRALAARDIPVSCSNHAGTYVCNHVFYSARHALETLGANTPCGFIHVPGLLRTEGETTTGLPLETMIEAVELCLDVLRGEGTSA